ncbi:MAG: energy-coupling factor transporter transmembrane protein EcfT [Oscillospiraceae bacterium]|nr:energy-coupling factor transporter transmembrane protein EcfT [Oscillospiraceae bacterium]
MAIKDITLGQYFPGDTFIHRLDPRIKIIFVILFIIALFLCQNVLTYAILAAILVAEILISKVGFKAVLRGMRPILLVVAITAVLNLFYTKGEGEPLLTLWKLEIYAEGVRSACYILVRIAMLIACTFLLTYTTSPMLLTDGIESLLSPLKKLKAPVHELAMMMAIALRFIPTLIEETDKIMSAQKARGAEFDTGSLLQKAKALIPLLIPLFVSSFRRANELAIAMECRCYHGGEGRTKMRQFRLRAADISVLLFGLVMVVGIGTLGHFGF